jgi:hypothetical protein
MTQFVQVIDRVLSSYAQLTSIFIPADILQPWEHSSENSRLHESSDWMG